MSRGGGVIQDFNASFLCKPTGEVETRFPISLSIRFQFMGACQHFIPPAQSGESIQGRAPGIEEQQELIGWSRGWWARKKKLNGLVGPLQSAGVISDCVGQTRILRLSDSDQQMGGIEKRLRPPTNALSGRRLLCGTDFPGRLPWADE